MAGDAVRPRRPRRGVARWSGDERQSRSASWPGLTRPSRLALPMTGATSPTRCKSAEARSLDGRVKPGHDGGLRGNAWRQGRTAPTASPFSASAKRRRRSSKAGGRGRPSPRASSPTTSRPTRPTRACATPNAPIMPRRASRAARARRRRLPARRWSSPSSPPTRPKPRRSPPCPASLAARCSSTAIPARRRPRRARQAKSRRRADAMSTSP